MLCMDKPSEMHKQENIKCAILSLLTGFAGGAAGSGWAILQSRREQLKEMETALRVMKGLTYPTIGGGLGYIAARMLFPPVVKERQKEREREFLRFLAALSGTGLGLYLAMK